MNKNSNNRQVSKIENENHHNRGWVWGRVSIKASQAHFIDDKDPGFYDLQDHFVQPCHATSVAK